ncbi:hypothetical protein HMPREF1248_0639 [Coriobacteriaceae bacterium BV3Ac1]|nr:hypothetical protein HMPREF1248_0639 [Coriobacteriaceae bacterium BV3Ac1]
MDSSQPHFGQRIELLCDSAIKTSHKLYTMCKQNKGKNTN